VRAAYLSAIGAGWVSPSEFWRLHPQEFWWLYEAKMPPNQNEKYQELYELLG